jgi:hypothetical protein
MILDWQGLKLSRIDNIGLTAELRPCIPIFRKSEHPAMDLAGYPDDGSSHGMTLDSEAQSWKLNSSPLTASARSA